MPYCKECRSPFEVSAEDLKYYSDVGPVLHGARVGVPAPTLCFQCRVRRKLAFRNERHLYKRKCSSSGREIFSIYSPDKSLTVYDNPIWYGDSWDALSFGIAYDPTLSFMDQFGTLLSRVPRPARIEFETSENSDFCNHHLGYKDCYLCFWGDYNQRSICCYGTGNIDQCVECRGCMNSTGLIGCTDCSNCNNCEYISDCVGVSDSRYMRSCVDCNSCFQCVNLRHKKFCIRNVEYHTRAAYTQALCAFVLGSYRQHLILSEDFNRWASEFPVKAVIKASCENSTGHHISNSVNTDYSFWSIGEDNRNSKYCVAYGIHVFNLYDCYGSGYNLTNCYEAFGLVSGLNDSAFSFYSGYGSHDLYYCVDCASSNNLFGCVGLKHKSFCILNKQYSESEYHRILEILIPKMRAQGEWGEFFPMSISPFGYNESAAADHFPLSEAEVLALGGGWSHYEKDPPTVGRSLNAKDLPDRIEDITDDILSTVILCEESGRPFKITKLELQYYREHNAPLSRIHPDLRLKRLAESFGPFRLWKIRCATCGAESDSGYPPDGTRKLVCEKCYQDSI